MNKLLKISIRKIGIVLTVLISVIAMAMIITNIFIEASFEKLSKADIDNYLLSKELKEIDLPLKVLRNVATQEVGEEEREARLTEAFMANTQAVILNGEESFRLMAMLKDEIQASSLLIWTDRKYEVLAEDLDDVSKRLELIIEDVHTISDSGSLDHGEAIEVIIGHYDDLLLHYDNYYIEYLEYVSILRTIYTRILNIAFIALILVVVSLILLVFRLLDVDMRLIERTYKQIEQHDFRSNKIIRKGQFLEEVKIQETIKKFFDNQRIIVEFQELVSKKYVIDDILDHLLSTLHEVMAVDRVGIAFYDEKSNTLITEYGAAVYEDIYLDVGHRSDLNTSDLKKIIESREGYINNNLMGSFQKKTNSESMGLIIKEGIRSNMSIPLIINNDVFGVVFFSSRQINHFTKEHYKFAENLLYEITGVLNRSYLMKVFIVRMTNTIARLVDKKDIETGDHINRMVKYSSLIANNLREMKVATHDVDNKTVLAIERNAAIHDIGKVGTPDNILKKPGKLTSEEYEIMKDHAAVGGDIFSELNRELEEFDINYFHTAENIARHHHEKWDGTGYPLGLKAFDIPIEARIVALADVFDALTSKRVYKEAFSFDWSIEHIKEQAGKHFDPVIVEAFIYDLESVRKIYDQFS